MECIVLLLPGQSLKCCHLLPAKEAGLLSLSFPTLLADPSPQKTGWSCISAQFCFWLIYSPVEAASVSQAIAWIWRPRPWQPHTGTLRTFLQAWDSDSAGTCREPPPDNPTLSYVAWNIPPILLIQVTLATVTNPRMSVA